MAEQTRSTHLAALAQITLVPMPEAAVEVEGHTPIWPGEIEVVLLGPRHQVLPPGVEC